MAKLEALQAQAEALRKHNKLERKLVEALEADNEARYNALQPEQKAKVKAEDFYLARQTEHELTAKAAAQAAATAAEAAKAKAETDKAQTDKDRNDFTLTDRL